MIRPPRELFHASIHFAPWKETIAKNTAAFEHACQTALLEMQMELSATPDPSRSWDAHNRLVGARRVIEILSMIHEPFETPKEPKYDQLNYKA